LKKAWIGGPCPNKYSYMEVVNETCQCKFIKPGDELARPVFTASGKIILNSGVVLKENYIEKFKEENFKEEADRKASEMIVAAMQRVIMEKPEDPVISVVELPSEEIKGRIIGREGRNIRTFERINGS